jgi:3-phosphoshikimate 1-carboxyvinyltransferase
MLRGRGVRVRTEPAEAQAGGGGTSGVAITIEGGQPVEAIDQRIPGDVSAAAFWLVAGAVHPDAELTLRGVGVNPTRRAVIDLLWAMGADIEERALDGGTDEAAGVGEPIADVRVRSSDLRGIEIDAAAVASAIDEIPILCLAAALARGETVIRGAGELRHKESDRIAGTAEGLRALGADVTVDGDDIHISGGARLRGATTDSLDDHRLAMTFAVAGLLAAGETTVLRPTSAAISYPGFFDDLGRVAS